MAVRLSDVLVRRLHLFYATATKGCAASPVAGMASGRARWDATRRAEEVTGYRELVERSRAFAKEAATVGNPERRLRRLRDLASSRRISRYSQISVTIRAKARTTPYT